MKTKLMVLCMVLASLALWACGSGDSETTKDPGTLGGACLASGTCNAGLKCVNDVCVRDTTEDGDENTDTDGDSTDEVGECSGTCNSMTDTTKCINNATDVCVCNSTAWTEYTCASICAREGKTAAGCGEVAGKSFPYCICTGTEDGDETDTDNDTVVEDGDPDTDTTDNDTVVTPGGQPCTFGPVNPSAGDCGTGLECIGAYLDGSAAGSTATACTADSDCTEALGSLAVCASGYCGMSFCTVMGCADAAGCTALGTGACCGEVSDTTACFPASYCSSNPTGEAAPGEPCNFPIDESTVINPSADACVATAQCIGAYAGADSEQPAACTGDADCASYFGSMGTCVAGYCGIAWCSLDCTGSSDTTSCTAMNDATYGKACCGKVGTAYGCYIPEFCEQVGNAVAGAPCKFSGGINSDADFCASGLMCLGQVLENTSGQTISCADDAACRTTLGSGYNQLDCVSGKCAVSWCAASCTADTTCATAAYGTGCCQQVSSDGSKACVLGFYCGGK